MSRPTVIERALTVARVDLTPTAEPPGPAAILLAAVVAVVGSLVADAMLVAGGTTVFPSTVGFTHFRFFDYGSLTVIGVLAACAAWPVVIRLSSTPRWLFFRLAVAVSLVLFLPDAYLLIGHESVPAVGVLMLMHLFVAVITYNALVHLSPERAAAGGGAPGVPAPTALAPTALAPGVPITDVRAPRTPSPAPGPRIDVASPDEKGPPGTYVWVAMMVGVGIELALGVVTLVLVPTGRPSGWIPVQGRVVYLAHAFFGGLLTLGGLALVRVVRRLDRMSRIAVIVGLGGIALGAVGGILATDHPMRLLGMGLMLVGTLVAGFAYLMPIIEALPDPTPTPAP